MARAFPFRTSDGRAGIVRVARPRDARACLAITWAAVRERPRTIATTEGEFWTPSVWRRHRLDWSASGATLLAEIAGRVVGSLGVHRGSRAHVRHTAEFGVTVAPDARGVGVGRALIETAETWAVEHGVSRMTLSVFGHNEHARRLYLSMGYVEEGGERGGARFPEGSVDVVRMAKFLGASTPGYDEVERDRRHGG